MFPIPVIFMKDLALFLFGLLPLPVLAGPVAKAAPVSLTITHVTVIDATGGPAQQDMTVVIEAGRIAKLGRSANISAPEGVRVIDGTGKFLIPGLWDMHVHIPTRDFLTLFVANGVTGVRDMHAFFPPQIFGWRKETADGTLLGPRIVATGALIDGPKPIWPGSLTAANADEGRKAVRTVKERGGDFVKVYTKLPREAFFAIADEAKKQGLTFAGHVPESVSALEASDAGQKSMEHLLGIAMACSAEEANLRKEIADAMAQGDVGVSFGAIRRVQAKALDSYSPTKAEALFARFAKNGTWQVPTLTVLRSIASLGDPQFTNDPRVKYMSAFVRNFWDPKNSPLVKSATAVDSASRKRIYQEDVKLVRALHRAGVPILAGTDTTNPYCFPGFSLHDELALLVDAGLSPMEALQSATSGPARFLGQSDKLGTIEEKKEADLVLLEANPLDDIRNTQKIAAVIHQGKLLDRAALDKLLADVEAANKK
jgi:imidazolonepropionase-like amidohydrolase